MEVSSAVAKSRKCQKRSVHPFKTQREFENAVAPFLKFENAYYDHAELWPTDFKTRVLRSGVFWASAHTRLVERGQFKGTFAEYLRVEFSNPVPPDDTELEIMQLYGIPANPAAYEDYRRNLVSLEALHFRRKSTHAH